MAIRTTRNEILRNYPRTICLGYCAAQFLFPENDALCYTAGTYGWNANIYIYPELRAAVCTGYRPFGKFRASREIVERYDELARKQIYEARNYDLRGLQMEFVKEVLAAA